MTKITNIEIVKLKVPLNKPMRTRYVNLEHAYCMLLIITTNTGLSGQGLIRLTNHAAMNIVEDCILKLFSPQLIDYEISKPEQLWQDLWLNKRNHLQSGYALYALAAIDIAIWDIHAKIANLPLYQLLNIQQNYVTPYGNGGWLSETNLEIQKDVEWYLDRGCNFFKMRIGGDNDHTRIKSLRDTFGNDLHIAVDANQYYTDFNLALEMSKYLADYDIAWFEEPLFSSSITELAKLTRLSPVPIATGENMNSHWQFQDACALNAAQIFQPDVIYHGGITEFKRSAQIIDKANLAMGSHLFHELSCSITGLCKQHYVEHIDFFPNDLFTHDFSIQNGKIYLPSTPGHGVIVSKLAINKYSIK